MPLSALIAVATYRRPEQLAALLASVAASVGERTPRIVVIENDPAESARAVAAASPIPVEYVVQGTPGLAAVRNRALEAIGDEDVLIFIDDDETVDAGWFAGLTEHAEASGADVVTGPVVAEFPLETPRWIQRGGFIQRPRFETGTTLTTAASNNTLLRVASWRRFGSPRFDPAFSTMGGEDTDFFWRLGEAGARIEFCDNAVAREPVASERLRLGWVVRRAYSAGLVVGVIRAREQKRSRILLSSIGASGVGALTMAKEAVTGGVQTDSFERTLGGIGRIASLVGARTNAYSRD